MNAPCVAVASGGLTVLKKLILTVFAYFLLAFIEERVFHHLRGCHLSMLFNKDLLLHKETMLMTKNNEMKKTKMNNIRSWHFCANF